ncbi:universal stress protein [Streptomyces sp. NPDC029216]|uniref:universal stress protein n=1 Tax=Streptomyces sp. NPDC029216 TaxID=3154701 RepID=UPI0033CCB82F
MSSTTAGEVAGGGPRPRPRRRSGSPRPFAGPSVSAFDPASIAPEVRDGAAAGAAAALGDVLRPWRGKYPDVHVEEESVVGQSAGHLVDASTDASLLVVGRRIRRSAIGPHLGPVAHAVLHHSAAPAAVVPHP